MLSKQEIDALLQAPKSIVRKATANDLQFIMGYINAHPEHVSEEISAMVAQLHLENLVVTNETAASIAFGYQAKTQDSLTDSWFIIFPK